MWFLQALFIFLGICGIISLIAFLLSHYGSSVKVYLISTDRLPLDTSKEERSAWAQAERKRVKDLEALPPEMK